MHLPMHPSPKTLKSTRREFLVAAGLSAAVAAMTPCSLWATGSEPRADAIRKFREAKFGMFVHYGLPSMLPGGKLRPWELAVTELGLGNHYAENFNANAIADLAVEAGMHYVNFTPFHGGGPYNWRSKVAHPNTFDDMPCKRDLVGEMAAACQKRGLGFFLYVHWTISTSRADVHQKNLSIFKEWLTQYGPLTGLWFDSDSYFYKDTTGTVYPHLAETYAQIRKIQPESLISFCHGVTGDEDYITYEHQHHKQAEFKFVPVAVQQRLAGKPVEITTTLQLQEKDGKGTKMWFHVDDAYHRTADEVWRILGVARRDGCNLLLNVAPRGDGSIDPAEIVTLREVGRRLRKHGFPINTEKTPLTNEAEDR